MSHSAFSERASALENAFLTLARDAATPITPETSSSALFSVENALKITRDSEDPLDAEDAKSVEHAFHRACVTLLRDAQSIGAHPMRLLASGGDATAMEDGAFEGEDAEDAYARSALARLFDHALTLAETSVTGSTPLFTMIEIVVESCTIRGAADALGWCEKRRERLKAPGVWKKLPTMRTFIALMKRCVGRGMRDAVVKGRVHMLLYWFLGVSDRSGLNLSGECNPNVTQIFEQEEWVRNEDFDGEAMEDEDVQIKMEIDASEKDKDVVVVDDDGGGGDGGDAMDADEEGEGADEFHRTFWSLQYFYQNPPKTMMKDGAWNTYSASLIKVLEKLEAEPLGETAIMVSKADDWELTQLIGLRYLTARRLLPLQLKDYAFRRKFLIQTALFLDCVSIDKYASHVVDDEVKELMERVMSLLGKTGPDAERVVDYIALTIEDEANWREWKEQGCPSFEKEPIDLENAPMPPNYDIKYSAWPPDQYAVIEEEFENDPVHLQMKDLARYMDGDAGELFSTKAITTEKFLEPCLEEMDPEAQIEEQYRKVNDPVFRWKAMRLISQSHMHLFPKLAAEGLESVIPDILGVPDPRPPKPEAEEGNAKGDDDSESALDDQELPPMEDDDDEEEDAAAEGKKPVEGEIAEKVQEQAVEKTTDEMEVDDDSALKKDAPQTVAEEKPVATETPEKRAPSPAKTSTVETKQSTENDEKSPNQKSEGKRTPGQDRPAGRGGRGGRGRRGGRAGRDGPQRDRSPPRPSRGERPPPQQQQQQARQPPPQQRRPPQQQQAPPPQRQVRQGARGGRYAPPPRQNDRQGWQRDNRGNPRQEAPPPRQQLGKRRRDDDGQQSGGQQSAPDGARGPVRARGNQGQRYNRYNNRNRR